MAALLLLTIYIASQELSDAISKHKEQKEMEKSLHPHTTIPHSGLNDRLKRRMHCKRSKSEVGKRNENEDRRRFRRWWISDSEGDEEPPPRYEDVVRPSGRGERRGSG